MPFGLTLNSERAKALQESIQNELARRDYSPDSDSVMAEYITIMIINNKGKEQVTQELEDLIGSDFHPSFTDWLFAEAAKGEAPPEPTSARPPPAAPKAAPENHREQPPHIPTEPSRANHAPRPNPSQPANNVPSTTPQKRNASARSPSPSSQPPHKTRRTDVPTGPRAMQGRDRDGPSNGRSLLERVGGRHPPHQQRFAHDEIQERINNITATPDAQMQQQMMMNGGFPGMDMGFVQNPLLMQQEIMMQQMAMMNQMQQMAATIGMAAGMGGFAPQNGADGGTPNNVPSGTHNNGPSRGRGMQRGGGRGGARGRGGTPHSANPATATPAPPEQPIAAPTPVPATSATPTPAIPASTSASATPAYAVPERPQSPSLCKFGTKCTNIHCRWSHPSPVATAESGVVLDTAACDNGKNCKDKDCVKSHVSPAVVNPVLAEAHKPAVQNAPPTPQPHSHTPVPCKFGTTCTRPNCPFFHPPSTSNQPCRFGTGCTRANCPFQHPEGRVLPTSFHRGLSTSAPLVTVPTPETGSMGKASGANGASHNRSVKFNNNATKEKLEQRLKELEAQKNEMNKTIAEKGPTTAASQQEDTKTVSITA